jgi:hypothetical protein
MHREILTEPKRRRKAFPLGRVLPRKPALKVKNAVKLPVALSEISEIVKEIRER